jgi:phenylpropionate dioxygenase-like ring-hydroxylating dioxygenase large terminal subunit
VEDRGGPLREAWYYAMPSRRLRPRQMLAKTMLGEPIVLGRDAEGCVFALRDIYPHRPMPLSVGRFDGREIECRYHGWHFDVGGRRTAIPSLVAGQNANAGSVSVAGYPVREVQGNIWVFFGDEPQLAPEIPVLDGFGTTAPQLTHSIHFASSIDHAVIGLMDPAHGPFVHRAWWWRTGRTFQEKAKAFEPSAYGFTMSRHPTSSNSRAYKVLGSGLESTIEFRLPGVRIETTRSRRHTVCNMTAITPIEAELTEINHTIYWTAPWLSALKPFFRPYMRSFLGQDRDAMQRQQEGLRFDPVLSLIDDADTQARWYYRLKEEYRRARAEGRPFANPVEPRILRWRS